MIKAFLCFLAGMAAVIYWGVSFDDVWGFLGVAGGYVWTVLAHIDWGALLGHAGDALKAAGETTSKGS